MHFRTAVAVLACAVIVPVFAFAADPQPPRAGKVEILKSSEVKPGMKAVAWTVFQGDTPEAVPIEIIGRWTNMWGPGQDIIIGKMGGKAERTNVAGGMSGSPVYIDGKLIGAVALRMSTFSPDAICGITPIELMLEINQFDQTKPADARTPQTLAQRAQATHHARRSGSTVSGGWWFRFHAPPASDDGAHRHAAALLRIQ